MIDFLEESTYFGGFTFAGCFDMNTDDLKVLYEHYKETGRNLLDDYCTVKYEKWELHKYRDPYHEFMIKHDELNKIRVAVSNMRRVNMYESELLREIEYHAKNRYEKWQQYQKRQISEERREACKYTSKENVRKWVFAVYGEECLKCGTTENITIDHIKPVARGGKNRLWNLQPLCQSCNSSKGTKTIDYRNHE